MVIRKIQKAGVTILLLLLFLTTIAAADTKPESMLDEYLKQVQTTLAQLEDKGLSSKQRLKLRSNLVNGRGHWLQKHGQPGRAVNLVGFFYRKAPAAWTFTPVDENDKFSRITVDFSVESFPGHPWRTEFDLVLLKDKWQIRSFKDLTRRPVPPGADIKTVLDSYFTNTKQAVEQLYSGKLGKQKKQATRMEYGFGAGYWIGQAQRKDLPAGTMFSYLISARPGSWKIEPERIAGAYAEAVVHLTSKPRRGDPVKKSYTFELIQNQGEWFITGHRSQNVTPDKNASPKPTVVASGDGPEKLVRTQLDLLGQKGVKMQDLVKVSEPLWLDTRNARRGMGRLIGMAMGLLGPGKSSPTWKYALVETDGSDAQVMVRAVWPQAKTIKLFSRIHFELKQTAAGWRLADAQILRN